MTLRNRVVMGAHFTMFTEPTAAGEPGYYGERTGRYLADRARGGVGAVICGQAAVHPTTAYQMPNNAAAWRPEAVDHFRRLTDQVHDDGAAAFLQLAHNGGVNRGNWSKLPVLAPSVISDYDEPAVAAGRRRHRRDGRGLRGLGGQRRGRRLRRHRGPRRPRLPDPRVPVAEDQPPRRPLRRLPREPDALRRRGPGRRPGRGRARRRRRASAWWATRSSGTAPASRPTTPPRSPPATRRWAWSTSSTSRSGPRAWAWSAPTTPGPGSACRPRPRSRPPCRTRRCSPSTASSTPTRPRRSWPTAAPTGSAWCGP